MKSECPGMNWMLLDLFVKLESCCSSMKLLKKMFYRVHIFHSKSLILLFFKTDIKVLFFARQIFRERGREIF